MSVGGSRQRGRSGRAALRLAAAWFAALLGAAAAPPLAAQAGDKDDDEIRSVGPVDPYTGGDVAVMQRAGIVAYGPFPWADGFGTADIDKVLGENRVLWLETKHFRIGSTFKSFAWPEQGDKRKALQEEIQQLRKLLTKVAAKPKRIDPWLRLHLYAQRIERCYADLQRLLGVTDADFPARGTGPREGAFLGQPDKFLLLLCQKKSDMARYMDRFCGLQAEVSMRYCHVKTHQMVACVAAEGLEGFDDTALHGHVVYATIHNLCNGYNGFHYSLPLWFEEGLAHWYSRKVPSDVPNVTIRDDEAVAEDKQNDWPVKVRRRAQHEGGFFPFVEMAQWDDFQKLGYHAHAQSWSRVDFLMRRDPAKVGVMLQRLKALPAGGDGKAQAAQARDLAVQLVQELYGLDATAFDAEWRTFVNKTYPKS
ncbi:MAG: hypothetical protein JNL08_17710 [Planctomycetes bacterium]|nr:hypothetical protein [Planctomycetota bacterium]